MMDCRPACLSPPQGMYKSPVRANIALKCL